MNRYNEIDIEVEHVANSLGVRLGRKILSNISGFDYEIRLVDLAKPYGFALILGDDYLSWVLRLDMDESSAPLIRLMGENSRLRGSIFSTLYSIASKRNSRIEFRVNGKLFTSPESVEGFDQWESVRFEISRSYLHPDEAFKVLRELLLDSLSTILCLVIMQEEWTAESSELSSAIEGERHEVLLSRPERNRYNRAICLQYHGFGCSGCGLKMDEAYGPLGTGVIHVHHLFPLSELDGPAKVDPILDLVPLCPNCHNIVHRVSPPLPIIELRSLTGFVQRNVNSPRDES
jgi:5-methylcytosine-specific restriction protein A